MFKTNYPYDLGSINPSRKKEQSSKDIILKQEERDIAIAFFLKSRDYKLMDVDTLISELNRFLNGNLR